MKQTAKTKIHNEELPWGDTRYHVEVEGIQGYNGAWTFNTDVERAEFIERITQ